VGGGWWFQNKFISKKKTNTQCSFMGVGPTFFFLGRRGVFGLGPPWFFFPTKPKLGLEKKPKNPTKTGPHPWGRWGFWWIKKQTPPQLWFLPPTKNTFERTRRLHLLPIPPPEPPFTIPWPQSPFITTVLFPPCPLTGFWGLGGFFFLFRGVKKIFVQGGVPPFFFFLFVFHKKVWRGS